MTGRRRRDGEPTGDDAPRVRGAWTTPAVVVRAPDGSIVDPAEARRRPAPRRRPAGTADAADGVDAATPGRAGAAAAGTAGGAGGRRPRVRPRRIPGAIGAALIAPSLLPDAGDDPAASRARRSAAPAATVTRLVPRLLARPGRKGAEAHAAEASLPAGPRAVAGRHAARRGRGPLSGPGARRPSPSGPGEPRRSRVLAAVAGLDLGRLAGPDAQTRERRRALVRRVGARLGVLALVAVLLYAIFPVRTYLAQREAAERGRKQLEVIDEENARLEKRVHDLQDKDTIEEMARERLGLVKPGEESYGMLPAPHEPEPGPTTTTTTPSPTAPPG